MPISLAELGRQECFDEIPGYSRSHGPAAHTNNVHVVILYALPGREVVVDQPGAYARDFVGTDRRAHAATAYRDAALYLPKGYRLSQRDDEVGIVVTRRQRGSTVLDYLMPGCAKMSNQLFLQ